MAKKKKVSKLGKKLKNVETKKKLTRDGPLWKGPEEEGVTQSMLSSFIQCRMRTYVKYVLGIQAVPEYSSAVEFGQMWHCCEEHKNEDWITELKVYARGLCKEYPLQQTQVVKDYQLCETEFVLYLDFWSKHKQFKKAKTVLSEHVFKVPYKLPSGGIVLLKGKMDGVISVPVGRGKQFYLWENKTKTNIREDLIEKQLSFDLQTMVYLIALRKTKGYEKARGVVYNVIRRPGHRQGKGSKNKPPETLQEFCGRVGGIIEKDPQHFFMRWQSEITESDIEKFENDFLIPCLEQLCDWYETVVRGDFGFSPRTPYGIYNVLADGGTSNIDEYMRTGDMTGLVQTKERFTELKE